MPQSQKSRSRHATATPQNRTASRRAALRAIVESEKSETPLFALLDQLKIAANERGFARELCGGVMRCRARLDYSLQPLLKKPLEKLDSPVRAALRLALYERVVLQTPLHVVADEYAGLMRGERLGSAVGFVNAVARKLPELWRISPEKTRNPTQFLSIEYSHPSWIVERYLARLGFDQTEKQLQFNNAQAALCLRVNTLLTTRDRVLEALQARGLNARKGAVAPDAIWILDSHGAPDSWPEWTRGEIIAQDEAAQVVARVVSPRHDATILDAASAPGGKTTHLAQLMNDKGHIIACDRSESRLRLVQDNARRLGIENIQTHAVDFRLFDDSLSDTRTSTRMEYDAVLLDAPCLGTGTWRRRPDARWRKTPSQLAELVQLQRELLDVAARNVRVGGALVYSTCSLEPEENDAQIQAFLERHHNWKIDREVPDAAHEVNSAVHDENGFWRTAPHHEYSLSHHEYSWLEQEHSWSENVLRPDGMFAARLLRTA